MPQTSPISAPADPAAPPFLDVLLSNPPHAWIVAGATLAGLILAFYVLRVLILTRLAKLAERTAAKWDDVLIDLLRRIRFWLIFPALVHLSSQALALPGGLRHSLRVAMLLGIGLQLLIAARVVVDAGLEALVRRTRSENAEHDATIASSLGVVRTLAVGLIGLLVVLFTLDNLGVAVTPMLTGLGIGGIAVALAAQNILGDLFGSVTILLDKPFVVGDSIAVGDKAGTVERIGIKTTRVRANSGEQLVFANSDLLSSRVQNFKRMQERRIVFTIGIAYETPVEKVAAIPAMIRAAVEKRKPVRFDRSHFKSFGAYSLDFETVYFVLSGDYKAYMDVQQEINLELLERFAAEGIDFAYPTHVAIGRAEPNAKR
jgi:small-conductance mechanosensitive channel